MGVGNGESELPQNFDQPLPIVDIIFIDPPQIVNSAHSRLQVLGGENTYLGGGGGEFDAFFNVVCILGVFLGGFGILGGKSPQEIAGNNTGSSGMFSLCFHWTFDYFKIFISTSLHQIKRFEIRNSNFLGRGSPSSPYPRLSFFWCVCSLSIYLFICMHLGCNRVALHT